MSCGVAEMLWHVTVVVHISAALEVCEFVLQELDGFSRSACLCICYLNIGSL